ncbi:hypothetical protein D3C71_2110190 [compost metagenome]
MLQHRLAAQFLPLLIKGFGNAIAESTARDQQQRLPFLLFPNVAGSIAGFIFR